ncbi:putative transcriptional regulator [Kordia periserrulae]|uniref:Putative transcriptional regulator n=1 Tax=Kordia periserrulae TaxID=701523 RepID=A0A2T6C642_9FLAO|nr:BlaI/MecI/CopY family transcriptional regulator [Kordia periserrulae]PTX63767.1 putative transcriptional regulator [Kordia periserrulae]
MKQLTKAEEEIMQILWQLERANVKTIIEHLKGEKPAYNTVSTIVRILESKGFVGYEKVGKGHIYFPLLPQSEYSNQSISKLVNGYFQGSFKSMVSFFMQKNDISTSELEEIRREIEKNNQES